MRNLDNVHLNRVIPRPVSADIPIIFKTSDIAPVFRGRIGRDDIISMLKIIIRYPVGTSTEIVHKSQIIPKDHLQK